MFESEKRESFGKREREKEFGRDRKREMHKREGGQRLCFCLTD